MGKKLPVVDNHSDNSVYLCPLFPKEMEQLPHTPFSLVMLRQMEICIGVLEQFSSMKMENGTECLIL